MEGPVACARRGRRVRVPRPPATLLPAALAPPRWPLAADCGAGLGRAGGGGV